MKRPLIPIAAALAVCFFVASCASKRTVTMESKRDPMMQHFAGNFEHTTDENGRKRSSSDRRSAFEGRSFNGEKSFQTKSFDRKEFRAKAFEKEEFEREAFAFGGERNLPSGESPLTGQRSAEAGRVANTGKKLFDRNKQVARTPFAEADKVAPTKGYFPAEKAQWEGDAEFKGTVQSYQRDEQPITFSDIKAMLGR